MYALLLTFICLAQVKFVVGQGYGDWSAFWAAGSTVGTGDLLDPHKHAAWMAAHHLLKTIFPYTPGAAWFLLPFKPLSLPAGYAINFAIMAVCTIAAAGFAARVYRIPRSFATLMMFAWAPLIGALATAQNSPVGLLLAMAAICAMIANEEPAAGLAAGALVYKWPYAIAFIALFIIRRQYRALAIAAACALIWYLLSVAATAGDWNWPAHYVSAVHAYFGADARYNAEKAVGLPMLLMRFRVPDPVAIGAGLLLFTAALPLFARAPLLESASMAPLIALAASPHTLPYDLALALPALFYVMTHIQEPLRTRLVCALYLIAPLWLLSGVLHFDVLAVVCNAWAIAWILKGYNESTSRADFNLADSRDRGQA
jgi:hypothetical protein